MPLLIEIIAVVLVFILLLWLIQSMPGPPPPAGPFPNTVNPPNTPPNNLVNQPAPRSYFSLGNRHFLYIILVVIFIVVLAAILVPGFGYHRWW